MKRFFAFPLVRLALVATALAVVVALTAATTSGRHGIWTGTLATAVIAASLICIIALVERFTTGRTLASAGFEPRFAGRGLASGLGLGALMFSLVVLELTLGGHYHVTGVHWSWDLAIAVLLAAAGAVLEEALFRGVVFRLIEEWAGSWIALAFSAILFGAAHAFNPGATWISTVAIALEAGVLLGAAFVVTKNLWFPIGLHFAWNYFEGPVYGTQVSGHAFSASLLTAHIAGPPWLTGGAFGPEAGVPAIATTLIASAALLAYASGHSLIVPLLRSRRAAGQS